MTAQIRTIIVPVDSSANAGRAAEYGLFLARRLGAKLVLAHALFERPSDLLGPVGHRGNPGEVVALEDADVGDNAQRSSEAAFKAAREAMGAANDVNIEQTVINGPAAESLIAFAGTQPDVVIVMGTRGLSPMRELLMGSVSERVMRHAACPVMLVR